MLSRLLLARTPLLAVALLGSPLLAAQDEGAEPEELLELEFEDELFDLDDLDALIGGELIEEPGAGGSDGPVRGVQGFVELSGRAYLRDRDEGRNDEQLLASGELELDLRFGDDWTGYVRPRFLVDLLDGDYDRFQPFEGYVTWERTGWDLRAGAFVENWGVVDTYNPVDVLNRRDFGSDLLDADRLGEVGLRLRRSFGGNDTFGEPTLSLYALPVWQPTLFAPEDQRFAIAAGGLELDEDAAFEPGGDERWFLGARLQSTWNASWWNADLQAVVADGPSRFPGIQVDAGALLPVYHSARVLGFGLRAVPNEDAVGSTLAKLTLKAEVAHTANDELDGAPVAAPDDFTAWVVGVDRVFDGVVLDNDSLTTTAEYARESGADDAQAAFRPFRDDLVLRALWEAGDFERTSLEARALIDLSDDEWIGELLYETQLRSLHEDLKLIVQLQLFDAADPGESLFGLFPDNSSLRVGLRMDF